jgi:hypothetical protein
LGVTADRDQIFRDPPSSSANRRRRADRQRADAVLGVCPGVHVEVHRFLATEIDALPSIPVAGRVVTKGGDVAAKRKYVGAVLALGESPDSLRALPPELPPLSGERQRALGRSESQRLEGEGEAIEEREHRVFRAVL